MIAGAVLIAFVPVAALLTITPGTDTMLVLRTAGLGGARPAALAALGIALGCMVWGLAVALGLGALLVASPIAFDWLRMAGAAYLAWLGAGLIVRPHHPGRALAETSATAFLTLLPQFLPRGQVDPAAGLMLAGVQVALTLVWFALLIGFARSLAPLITSPAFTRIIDRVCGAVFIGFGLKLALAKA